MQNHLHCQQRPNSQSSWFAAFHVKEYAALTSMLIVCKKCGLRGEFDKEPDTWFSFTLRKGKPECPGEEIETVVMCPDCGQSTLNFFGVKDA
jgi:hypothetical protein